MKGNVYLNIKCSLFIKISFAQTHKYKASGKDLIHNSL